MDEFIKIASAISAPARVRILMMLRAGELCACCLTNILGLAPSTVSRHVFLLKNAGLIESRKQGGWIYYRLSRNCGRTARAALDLLFSSLRSNKLVISDKRRAAKMKDCLGNNSRVKKQNQKR